MDDSSEQRGVTDVVQRLNQVPAVGDGGGPQSEADEISPEERANWNLLLRGME